MNKISLYDLVVFRSSLYGAFDDCQMGNCSKSKGPVEVFPLRSEANKFQLFDGHHRLIEYLTDQKHIKNNNLIPVKIVDKEWVRKTYSIAPEEDRWEYDGSMKYGNLEDLADEDIIGDLSIELHGQKNEAKLSKLLNFLFEVNDFDKILFHGSPNKFDHFNQKPWKAFDGKVVPAPIWLTPNKKFAAINAGPNGWIYEVAIENLKTFPDKELRTKRGNYIIPTKFGEKLIEDMVSHNMFDLENDDWHEAEEILKSIDKLNYDVLETGDFIKWLEENGYNSFLVKGDGPTNVALLDADDVHIVKKYKANSNISEMCNTATKSSDFSVFIENLIK